MEYSNISQHLHNTLLHIVGKYDETNQTLFDLSCVYKCIAVGLTRMIAVKELEKRDNIIQFNVV